MDGGSAYHIDTDDVRRRKPALLFPGIRRGVLKGRVLWPVRR